MVLISEHNDKTPCCVTACNLSNISRIETLQIQYCVGREKVVTALILAYIQFDVVCDFDQNGAKFGVLMHATNC